MACLNVRVEGDRMRIWGKSVGYVRQKLSVRVSRRPPFPPRPQRITRQKGPGRTPQPMAGAVSPTLGAGATERPSHTILFAKVAARDLDNSSLPLVVSCDL